MRSFEDWSDVSNETVDLAIVGGGINGAGIARDAALRGLDVVLVEKDDFASGTSSSSTKLAHGGLRYLEQYEFGLVFEALRERKILREIASHLVTPQQFLFPVYERTRVPAWQLRIGLNLYDALSLFRNIGRHKFLDKEEIKERFPELVLDDLTTAALYYDCQMDDSRIVLENVIDADNLGATVLNYCEAKDLERTGSGNYWTVQVFDRMKRETFSFNARKIVNATGPWSDHFADQWRNNGKRCLRPTKGVHLVLPELEADVAGFFPSVFDDDRIFFAIPWEGRTLLGTTDTEFEKSPDHIEITKDDRQYLLTNLNRYLEGKRFSERDILAEFAGLRPLYEPSGSNLDESEVSRDHQILEEDSIYSVLGGKYTTYRSIAAETLQAMDAPGTTTTDRRCLPGGWLSEDQKVEFQDRVETKYDLSQNQISEIMKRYGRRCLEVLDLRKKFDDALEPVGDSSDIPIRAQVYHAVLEEGARKPVDVIRRRTNLFLQQDDQLETIKSLMSKAVDGFPDEDIVLDL